MLAIDRVAQIRRKEILPSGGVGIVPGDER